MFLLSSCFITCSSKTLPEASSGISTTFTASESVAPLVPTSELFPNNTCIVDLRCIVALLVSASMSLCCTGNDTFHAKTSFANLFERFCFLKNRFIFGGIILLVLLVFWCTAIHSPRCLTMYARSLGLSLSSSGVTEEDGTSELSLYGIFLAVWSCFSLLVTALPIVATPTVSNPSKMWLRSAAVFQAAAPFFVSVIPFPPSLPL